MKVYCNLPRERLKIDANGDFQSCCHQTVHYGNIIEDDINIEDIPKIQLLRDVRVETLNNKLHSNCNNRMCPLYHTNLEKNNQVSLTKYPKQIELALPPTWCNIGGLNPTQDTACIMCPRSSLQFIQTMSNMDDRTDLLLEKVKPAIPYLETFTILGIAEPFYKGRIFEILDKIEFKKYKEKILFWSFSNGTLFSEKYQDLFLYEYTDKSCIGFSIDAANPETYIKIRRLDYLKTIERNLESFFKKTHDFNHLRDWSFVTYNINMINLYEMEDMLRFGNSIGADKVQYNLTYISDPGIKIDRDLLCNENNWEFFWEQQLKIEELAKVLNQKIEFYIPFHNGYLNKK